MNPTINPQGQEKVSLAKKTTNVIGIILLIPVGIVVLVILSIVIMSVSHGFEKDKLEKETTSLFQNSQFATEGYDCRDVELRNQCEFIVDAPASDVATYLQQQGFEKNDTYGDGFKKGDLYIINNDIRRYSSYYQSN